MQKDDPHSTLAKTQAFMYNTLAPISTPRRRYRDTPQSITKRNSVLSRTTDPQNIHLAASLTKQNSIQLQAPIFQSKKQQKSIILQQWLNNALEGESQDSSIKQPLKTLKKYGLDKANLRNLHLSHETIQKLYKGLFVYTSGMKNAFQEMLSESKLMPRQDNILPKIYFKVFIKLFENISPIKSCYQIIENQHNKTIQNLKRKNLLLVSQREKDIKQYEQIERKLKRQVEELQTKITTIMMDYRVMEANLQLYEVSFNDEVLLRLKFQEKINQTYTSYEELKSKYQRLREEIGYKNEILTDNIISQKTNAETLANLTIQNKQFKTQNEILVQTLLERQQELTIKNQQIMDIRMVNQTQQQRKIKEENALDELITKINLLQKQKRQAQDKNSVLNKQIEGYLATISKLKNDLISARQRNDQVYIKLHQTNLTILPMQKENLQKNANIAQLHKELNSLKTINNLLEQQNEANKKNISILQEQLDHTQKNLKSCRKEIQQNNNNIIEMKAIKDKYQRINNKLNEQIKMQKLENGLKVKELAQFNQKNTQLKIKIKMLQNSLSLSEQKISILNVGLISRDQTIKGKREIYESKISQIQGMLKTKEKQYCQKNESYRKIFEDLSRKQKEKLQKIEQISYLRKLNESQQMQVQQKKAKLNNLVSQNQKQKLQIQSLQKQLKSREYTLTKKKGDIDGEIMNLKNCLGNLKQKMKSREQHVHPMIIEDLTHQIARLHEKIIQINLKNEKINDTYQQLQKQLLIQKSEHGHRGEEVTKLNKTVQYYSKELLRYKQQINSQKLSFNKKIDQKNNQIAKITFQMKKSIESSNSAIRQYEKQLKGLTTVNLNIQNQISQLKQKLNRCSDKSKLIDKEQQTDKDANQNNNIRKLIEKDVMELGIQTDMIPVTTSGNGKKLTTSDRLRGKRQTDQIQVNTTANENKLTSEIISEEKETKEVQIPKIQHNSKKIEDKQFKTALKFTYLRR